MWGTSTLVKYGWLVTFSAYAEIDQKCIILASRESSGMTSLLRKHTKVSKVFFERLILKDAPSDAIVDRKHAWLVSERSGNSVKDRFLAWTPDLVELRRALPGASFLTARNWKSILDNWGTDMDIKRLEEIRKRQKSASFGYDAVNTQGYSKDVGDLLAEVDRLMAVAGETVKTIGEMTTENANLVELVKKLKKEIRTWKKTDSPTKS